MASSRAVAVLTRRAISVAAHTPTEMASPAITDRPRWDISSATSLPTVADSRATTSRTHGGGLNVDHVLNIGGLFRQQRACLGPRRASVTGYYDGCAEVHFAARLVPRPDRSGLL